jgi:hypothetical protein
VKQLNIYLSIFALLVLLSACTPENDLNEANAERSPVISETEAGDFTVRLVSERGYYKQDEQIRIGAQIKYTGDEEEIHITHADSPFIFEIREVTRGIDIPAGAENDSGETTLIRETWHRETYSKSMANNFEENEFLTEFYSHDGFPSGEYEIELNTEFYTADEERQRHHYYTSIMIQVE